MTSTTFYIKNHTITYNVNWFGVESITVDGNRVSKKLSLGKRSHYFNLRIDNEIQKFHIESKMSFSCSSVNVSLFQNDIVIDSEVLQFYPQITNTKNETETSDDSADSMFFIGIIFIVFSLCFDWSKFFLFIGLIFLFDGISKKEINAKISSEKNNDPEVNN